MSEDENSSESNKKYIMKIRDPYSRGIAKRHYVNFIQKPQEQNVQLQRELTHDEHLPELLNYHGFKEVVVPQVDMALRNKSKLVFGFIDMDKLKAINEKYGHDVGDEYIRCLGEVLTRQFKRQSDVIALRHVIEVKEEDQKGALARRGGSSDEFLISLPFIDSDEAKEILELARLEFEEKALNIRPDINVSFSFGVSEIREKTTKPYDRDSVPDGKTEVEIINAEDADPAYVMISALQVAESRMKEDKRDRKQGRE